MFIIFLTLFLFISTATKTFYEAHLAFIHTIQIEQPKKEDIYQEYANAIADKIPDGAPVLFLVPLNGTPDRADHSSYKTALVSLEVLRRIPNRKKYLLLSEGYTGTTCVAGSEITGIFIGLLEGYNSFQDVTLLLERHATTTAGNIKLSKPIILEEFPEEGVYVVIPGITHTFKIPGVDIGHAARGYMLARNNWNISTIHLVGILPANKIDPTIQGYSLSYNLATMVLGATGALDLPAFDKNPIKQEIPCEQNPPQGSLFHI